MGRVCTEAHVPSYINLADDMRKAGVQKVYCVAVAQPDAADKWAQQNKLPENEVSTSSH